MPYSGQAASSDSRRRIVCHATIRLQFFQFLEFFAQAFVQEKLGSNQGPITLPRCYLRLQNGLSVPPFLISYKLLFPFHGGNTGSNPVGDAKFQRYLHFGHDRVTIEPNRFSVCDALRSRLPLNNNGLSRW